jgi:hypothetical protein
MPMIGHIAETGQVVSSDFRQGKAMPRLQKRILSLYSGANKHCLMHVLFKH